MSEPLVFADVGQDPLAADMARIILAHERGSQRSTQRRLGPSEVGDPCARRLLYKIYDYPVVNLTDPWPAILGTAFHHWMTGALAADNVRLGRTRWVIEQKVNVGDGITGTCDAYDVDTATVVDHKLLGKTGMDDARAGTISTKYQIQAQLYGAGYAALGLPVRQVALVLYPRSGWLDGLHVWRAPYSPAIAESALTRLGTLIELGSALDLDISGDQIAHVPPTPGGCFFCPYHDRRLSDSGGLGCNGRS